MQRYKLLQRPNTTIFLLVLNFFKKGGGLKTFLMIKESCTTSTSVAVSYILSNLILPSSKAGLRGTTLTTSVRAPRVCALNLCTRDHWSCEDVTEIFSVISFINLYWKKISWTNFYFEDTLCKYATWTFKLTYVGKLIIYNTVPSCLCEQLEYISLLQRDHLTWNTSMYKALPCNGNV